MQAVVKKVVYSFRYRPGPGQVGVSHRLKFHLKFYLKFDLNLAEFMSFENMGFIPNHCYFGDLMVQGNFKYLLRFVRYNNH